ncbi:PIN domain-containing protein [Leifsonia sp. F6_8S_P_1B]|uniref:Ribonuclease VapC n=1 Tax=Leifsonia williamsii TaxID=3035919 RepID=A0ABT8KEI6_9MICO|nr:PIN domain-containing protein [Leifsonia williamsii]MDN4615873.1 PIN domain-containing protein [Leifsonia williamsii]
MTREARTASSRPAGPALLDTSVLISGLSEEMIDRIELYRSSMICRAELAQGLAAFEKDPSRFAQLAIRRELLRLLDSIPGFWLEFDRAASDAYGSLTAEPKTALPLKDALIAAHALAAGLPLLTEDAGFSRFPSVDVRRLR